MLARITGKSFREEANSRKTSYNLVAKVRQRRMRWLGFILREPQVHQAITVQLALGKNGDLRMDAPPHETMTDLVIAATAEKGAHWERLADSLFEGGKKRKRSGGTSTNLLHSPSKVKIKWNANTAVFKPTNTTEPPTFFQPGYKPEKPTKKQKKKPKPAPMSDAERQAAARLY